MSKINQKMIAMIEQRKNGSLGNTSVNTSVVASGEEITVCVHGQLIATFFPERDRLKLHNNLDSGLKIRRANALAGYFCKKGYSVIAHKITGATLVTPTGFAIPVCKLMEPSIPTLIY